MANGRLPGDRPVGVCIKNKRTGEKIPCELAYVGIDEDGLHEWAVATRFDWQTETITIAVLPPRTTLCFDNVDES